MNFRAQGTVQMPRHVYLQPDAPDPVLPDEHVLALARAHQPECRLVQHVEESGGEARTYLIDDDLLLKLQRPPQLRPLTSLAKERFVLTLLAQAPDDRAVSIPRVLGGGRDGSSIEYTLLTRMPGVALRTTMLDPSSRQAVLVELGRTLRRIHATPLEPVIASGLVPGDFSFPDTMTRIAEPLLDRAREVRDRGLAWDFPLSIEQIAGRALSSLQPTSDRALLHSNPYEEHVFVDPRTGRFAGLIDFGDAYVSHPALDVRRWNRPDDRQAVLTGYQETGAVSETWLRVWHALMIMADVNTMVQAPDRREDARHDLTALLAEAG
jgi:hygromycin-B 7''-O-kinase